MQQQQLIACHECDLLHRIWRLNEGQTALCSRCGAVLYRRRSNSFERSLALTLAGLILFVMANAYPLLEIKSGSLSTSVTLLGSVRVLFASGVWPIGVIVFLTTILFPLLQLLTMLFILIPLQIKKNPWDLSVMIAFIQFVRPWVMMEVFMLGILVSMVKLVKMMQVIPGISLWAFAVLIFVLASLAITFDFQHAWETVDGERT